MVRNLTVYREVRGKMARIEPRVLTFKKERQVRGCVMRADFIAFELGESPLNYLSLSLIHNEKNAERNNQLPSVKNEAPRP